MKTAFVSGLNTAIRPKRELLVHNGPTKAAHSRKGAVEMNMRRREAFDPFASMGMVPFSSPFMSSFMSPMMMDLMEPMFTPMRRGNNMFSMPRSEAFDQEREYIIRMEMTGFGKENVRTEIKGDNIVIMAEKMARGMPYDQESQTNNNTMQGQSFGWAMSNSFAKSYIIPEDVERQKISATMKDGILTLVLPKKDREEPAIETTSIPIA
eukprot:CAMPEP_0198731946 /NCGR_PEP_ID=MMETSP1475-20131203/32967_1 /TAXON_ID= ORGANISM="Unidentified sp., Strain CCMP1999" /NCGR_SAMPLE_ID=MMETSP1475 /ASSEMBLY_ACC=CAM_ASM_001111 /LENGTH=208 /DNA_ID=CAMNT_0044494975 /DNA_START=202 /DNA_END=828 /DNA_ORIENTATION=+